MKKYWKIVVICIVTVLTIGIFYYQVAKANKLDVTIQMDTISGSEKEIENVEFEGYYYENEFGYAFNLTNDGVTGVGSPSFLKSLTVPFGGSPITKEYVKNYRSFMRGKEMDELKFYENKTHITYVNIKQNARQLIQGNPITIEVDMLDKTTDKSASFEVHTTAETTYEWLSIQDVFVKDGKIKVFVKGMHVHYESEDLQVITIDEMKKEIVGESVISKVEDGMTASGTYQVLNRQTLKKSDYAVYKEAQYKEDVAGERELVSEKLLIYNKRTDEVKKLEVQNEDLQPYTDSVALYGSALIVVEPTDMGLTLHRYNIEQNHWEEPVVINSVMFIEEEYLSTRQIDEKLFVFPQSTNDNIIAVIDLTIDALLYEGKITVEKKDEKLSDYELSLYEVYLKE